METLIVKEFKELIAWQKAMELVTAIYRLTQKFPKEELYGLTSQLRRAAVSVPSNIAEGQARQTRGEFRQFLGHARGSLAEMETQFLIAQRLGYVEEASDIPERIAETGRVLNGLISSLATVH